MLNQLRLVGLAVAAVLVLALPAQATDSYSFDKSHADAVFKVSHLGFSNTWGRFNDVEGTLMLDEANPGASSVDVTIQSASIDTNHGKRDDHLRNADFFNVGAFPTITFKSTGVEVTGEKTARITGDFTLLGVTKPVVLDTMLNSIAEHPFQAGVTVAGFTATTTIKRSDFGMAYGVPGIGDEIEIFLDIEAMKQ